MTFQVNEDFCNSSEESLALCDRIINLLVLKILSTGAEQAIHSVCLNGLKKVGNLPLPCSQNSKTFEGTVIVAILHSNIPRAVPLVLLLTFLGFL